MVEIKRYKDEITILDHANYAEVVKDIVCIGVSALSQTLIRSIEELTEDKIDYSLDVGLIKFYTFGNDELTLNSKCVNFYMPR